MISEEERDDRPRLKVQRKASANGQLPTGSLGRKTKIGYVRMWIIVNRGMPVWFLSSFLSREMVNVKFRN